jgi:general secretion pathway protein J
LLELLVVMTLLSFIMSGLVYAMRTMGQTESRIDLRLEQLENTRAVHLFLQQTLTRSSAMPLDAPGAVGKTVVPFVATSDMLTWVGILPARANLGGRHFFRLAIEDLDGKHALVMRLALWQPDLIFTQWQQAESRILMPDLQQFKIQAKGSPKSGQDNPQAWPTGWQDGWPVADSLPEQVRLTLVDGRGDAYEWTYPTRTLPQGDTSYNRVAVGGGAPQR